MRPIDKWKPGTHVLSDGSSIEVYDRYDPYSTAKSNLSKNIGDNCSYCEKSFPDDRDLHVEHIKPKSVYPKLKTSWDNFLLSCSTCNGVDNKGVRDVEPGCHLPHLNNTFLSFKYMAGGVVIVNPKLRGMSKNNAEALYKLVRLDKTPRTSKPGDKRWKNRFDNWNLANRYYQKYCDSRVDVDTIIDLVRGRGGWSIWFTVFIGCKEVKQALVEQFPGTARDCFDANYDPISRHPENATDPI